MQHKSFWVILGSIAASVATSMFKLPETTVSIINHAITFLAGIHTLGDVAHKYIDTTKTKVDTALDTASKIVDTVDKTVTTITTPAETTTTEAK
jgi:hypothetical protein